MLDLVYVMLLVFAQRTHVIHRIHHCYTVCGGAGSAFFAPAP